MLNVFITLPVSIFVCGYIYIYWSPLVCLSVIILSVLCLSVSVSCVCIIQVKSSHTAPDLCVSIQPPLPHLNLFLPFSFTSPPTSLALLNIIRSRTNLSPSLLPPLPPSLSNLPSLPLPPSLLMWPEINAHIVWLWNYRTARRWWCPLLHITQGYRDK